MGDRNSCGARGRRRKAVELSVRSDFYAISTWRVAELRLFWSKRLINTVRTRPMALLRPLAYPFSRNSRRASRPWSPNLKFGWVSEAGGPPEPPADYGSGKRCVNGMKAPGPPLRCRLTENVAD